MIFVIFPIGIHASQWHNVELSDWTFTSQYSMAVSNNGTIYYGADRDRQYEFSLLKSADNGISWTTLNHTLPIVTRIDAIDIDPVNTDRVYISLATNIDPPGGGVHKSEDGGQSWEKTLAGRRIIDVTVNQKDPSMVFALSATLDSNSGFYKSTDYGNTWRRISNGINVYPTHFRSITVDPNSSDTLYIIATLQTDKRYGLHKSTDGGESWIQMNDGFELDYGAFSNMVIDPTNTDNLYLNATSTTQKNGEFVPGIYKSTDAGETWKRVTEEYPDIATYDVQLHEKYPNIIIASSSSLEPQGEQSRCGVIISTNYGEDWGFYHDGFPKDDKDFCTGPLRINSEKDYIILGTTKGIWKRDISDIVISEPTPTPTPTNTPTPTPIPESCIIENFPDVIRQNDRTWENIPYGGIWREISGISTFIPFKLHENNNENDLLDSIGNWGCAMTSYAMLINYHADRQSIDFETDPIKLNKWLQENEGFSVGHYLPNYNNPEYVDGSGVIPDKIIQYARENDIYVSLQMRPQRGNETYNEYLGRVGDYLDDSLCDFSNPAILRVSNSYRPNHYVTASGKLENPDPDTYQLHDPLEEHPVTLANVYNNDYISYQVMNPSYEPESTLYLSIASPIHVVMTDPLGRKLGYDPKLDDWFYEIPDGIYTTETISDIHGVEMPERKVIYIPNKLPGKYEIEVIGTGEGEYALHILMYEEDQREYSEYIVGNTNTDMHELYTITQSENEPPIISKKISIKVDPFNRHDIILYPWSKYRILPVVFYSTSTFDATKIDIQSITLGPDRATSAYKRGLIRDYNNDDINDIKVYFRLKQTGLTKETTELCAETIHDELTLRGCDEVTIMTLREFILYLKST